MPHFNLLQEFPEGCFEPVPIDGFVVTLVDVERFGSGYRWIYRIDNVDAPNALSDWVLAIEEPCREFIGDAYITPTFPSDEEPPELVLYEDVENPGTAPDPCPDDALCSPGEQVVGFKFDDLGTGDQGELDPGESQLFAFVFNQPPIATEACAALKFGQNEECGLICVPDCIECPNACDCTEAIDTFDCTFTFPSDCFTLPEGVTTDDVLSGYCIGEEVIEAPVACEGVAEVFVCGQTLICCCDVLQWTRSVPFQVQLNLPKEGECGGPVYECCYQEVTVIQNCYTCLDETPTFEPLTCENTSIEINSITDNEDGTVTVNYTIVLPDCVTEVVEEPPAVQARPTNIRTKTMNNVYNTNRRNLRR